MQRGALPPLTMAAGQDKGHRRKARGLAPKGFAECGGELGDAIIIEQVEELNSEPGGRFAALESRLQEGGAFGNQTGKPTRGG